MADVVALALLDRAQAAITKALDGALLGDSMLRVLVEEVRPAAGAAMPAVTTSAFDRELRVCKADSTEERYVLGIVLEPDTVDSQGEIYTAETIRQSAYLFMEEYANIGLQHQGLINGKVKILESWIQRDAAVIGGQNVKAGTWMLAVRVVDEELWTAVKAGRITGFSIGGRARRTPIEPP